MEYLAGLIIGVAICAVAAVVGFDRDRSFYPTVLIVIAALYVLFAVMGAGGGVVLAEALIAGAFMLAAIVGYRRGLWLVAAALLVHGLFDYAHPWLFGNPGVPAWWPGFCLMVDVVLAAWLGAMLLRGTRGAGGAPR